MQLTWEIPAPPKSDLLARLGRRWVVVAGGKYGGES
jgi:hypothetical protein